MPNENINEQNKKRDGGSSAETGPAHYEESRERPDEASDKNLEGGKEGHGKGETDGTDSSGAGDYNGGDSGGDSGDGGDGGD